MELGELTFRLKAITDQAVRNLKGAKGAIEDVADAGEEAGQSAEELAKILTAAGKAAKEAGEVAEKEAARVTAMVLKAEEKERVRSLPTLGAPNPRKTMRSFGCSTSRSSISCIGIWSRTTPTGRWTG